MKVKELIETTEGLTYEIVRHVKPKKYWSSTLSVKDIDDIINFFRALAPEDTGAEEEIFAEAERVDEAEVIEQIIEDSIYVEEETIIDEPKQDWSKMSVLDKMMGTKATQEMRNTKVNHQKRQEDIFNALTGGKKPRG